MKVDVIIPVYKPGEELFILLDKLNEQSLKPNKIILMNTEQIYFDQLTDGRDITKQYPNVEVYHLAKKDFDHGNTRRAGVRKSEADYFVMMTMDAIPADNKLIENLTMELSDKVAVTYGRQLPKEDCAPVERITRQYNYPELSRFKTKKDLQELGIKTYFCSDVCAAYNRKIYEQLGGFIRKAIFNEDMIFAASAINAGYAIYYCAEAKVYHSHNLSHSEQFHRNFDLAVSQAMHPEVFENISSEGEGKKMVISTTKELLKKGMFFRIPHFYIQCAAKYAGFFLGKRYKKLSKKSILKFTGSPDFWKDII